MSLILTILFWLFIGLPFIFLCGFLLLFAFQLIVVGAMTPFYHLAMWLGLIDKEPKK